MEARHHTRMHTRDFPLNNFGLAFMIILNNFLRCANSNLFYLQSKLKSGIFLDILQSAHKILIPFFKKDF